MAKDATKTQDEEPGSNLSSNTFLEYVNKQIDLDAQIKVLKDARKKLRASARADGIVLGDMDTVIAESSATRSDIREKQANLNRYRLWMNLPTPGGDQRDMFKDMADPDTAKAEWKQAGITAGLRGADPVAPDFCPAECVPSFMEGWHTGQRKLAETMPEKAEALRKKAEDGSRPKKSSREKTPEPA